MAEALPVETGLGGGGFLPDEAGRDCSLAPPRWQAYQWDGREDSLQGLRKSRVFRLACCRGEVAVAQWLWNLGKEDDTPGLDIADLREEDCILFFVACAQGDLAMAQWLVAVRLRPAKPMARA